MHGAAAAARGQGGCAATALQSLHGHLDGLKDSLQQSEQLLICQAPLTVYSECLEDDRGVALRLPATKAPIPKSVSLMAAFYILKVGQMRAAAAGAWARADADSAHQSTGIAGSKPTHPSGHSARCLST